MSSWNNGGGGNTITGSAPQEEPQTLSNEASFNNIGETPPRLRPAGVTPLFNDSPNARSKTITVADGSNTHGVLNQHAKGHPSYSVGVYSELGPRRTMEDAHSFVVDFGNIRGQGFFAVFDGHAGKHAAEWCGGYFHEVLLDSLSAQPNAPVPEILNQTFLKVDNELSKLAEEGQTHSGCTAVTAFLRLEDSKGKQSFLSSSESDTATITGDNSRDDAPSRSSNNSNNSAMDRVKSAMRSIAGRPSNSTETEQKEPPFEPPQQGLRRVLYTANAGDARAVLCRAGKGVRLTYDHKGSDKQEAKRIKEAGGFVMNNRVNGVLAVTRSLGDSSMKEFVVGSPYTTETELGDDDEFLIVACDGLWDVLDDNGAVDLIRGIQDAQEASKVLVRHALDSFSSDNITVLVVRFHQSPNSSH